MNPGGIVLADVEDIKKYAFGGTAPPGTANPTGDLGQIAKGLGLWTFGGTQHSATASQTGDLEQKINYIVGALGANPMPTVLSPKSMHVMDGYGASITLGSGTAVQNAAILYPFVVTENWTAQRAAWQNGATVDGSGHVCAALYDMAGNRLATTGNVTQAGTSVKQSAAFTAPPTLQPGRYYMAFGSDSATGTFTVFTGATDLHAILGGVRIALGANLPLPATLTPAVPAAANNAPLVSVANSTTH